MRKLNGHDVFAALKVLKLIGVKDELIQLATRKEDQRQMGARLVFGLLANCGTEEAEKAFFEFLGGPLEALPAELEEMDLMDLCEEVQKYIETIDKERWRSFFTSLVGALKATI